MFTLYHFQPWPAGILWYKRIVINLVFRKRRGLSKPTRPYVLQNPSLRQPIGQIFYFFWLHKWISKSLTIPKSTLAQDLDFPNYHPCQDFFTPLRTSLRLKGINTPDRGLVTGLEPMNHTGVPGANPVLHPGSSTLAQRRRQLCGWDKKKIGLEEDGVTRG